MMMMMMMTITKAVWLKPERVRSVELETETLLLFDDGGGRKNEMGRKLVPRRFKRKQIHEMRQTYVQTRVAEQREIGQRKEKTPQTSPGSPKKCGSSVRS